MPFFNQPAPPKSLLLFLLIVMPFFSGATGNYKAPGNLHPVIEPAGRQMLLQEVMSKNKLKRSAPLSDFLIIPNTDTIICAGTDVLISPSNSSGFLNPVFEWRKNNVPVSTSPYYMSSSLRNGDSIVCFATENGQQFVSNTLRFTVLGVTPLVHISPDNYSCSYSTVAAYANMLEFSNSLDDLALGATTIIPSGADNAVSALIPMPFTFKFAGSDFNRFSVSCNGRMAFGNTMVDSSGNNTDSFGNFTLMPWWDDLTTGTNGSVRYKFFVEKEFTKLVIEWNVNASDVNQPFDRTFQVRLVQDGNSIIYTYSNNPSIAGTGSASIAIAGSATDYQSALIQSFPQPSSASSLFRSDNNTWLSVSNFATRGAAFFNSCSMDSVLYGTPVVFTALADSSVPSPVYQWKRNNVNVGTNSRFYTDSSLINNDTLTCTLSSTSTCFINSTTSNQVYVHVKPSSYIFFTGNGNWSDPANWANGIVPATVIPAGTGIVIQPSPGGQCVVDVPVVVSRGAQLIIKPGSHFLVQTNLSIL